MVIAVRKRDVGVCDVSATEQWEQVCLENLFVLVYINSVACLIF